jgi:hypothetical protein
MSPIVRTGLVRSGIARRKKEATVEEPKLFVRTQHRKNVDRRKRQAEAAGIAKLIHDEGRSTMRQHARKLHRNRLKGQIMELAKKVMRRNDELWGAT